MEETQNFRVLLDEGQVDEMPQTLSEILEKFEVDQEEWIVERYLINTWQIGRRDEAKELIFVEGKISGSINDKGEIKKTNLYQIKVWIARKNPISFEPVISPIQITMPPVLHQPKTKIGGAQTALIIPDPHFGYLKDTNTGQLVSMHDQRALDIVFQIAQEYHFDFVIWLGDILDLAEWSDKFIRSPEMYFTTQPAIISASTFMAKIKSVTSDAVHVALAGNHEQRLITSIIMNLKQGYHLRSVDELSSPPSYSVERLLDLEGIGIEYIPGYPSGEFWLSEKIRCIHGNVVRAAPGSTMGQVVMSDTVTTIQGHIHRIEAVTRTVKNYEGKEVIWGISPGCLCKTNGVVPGSSNNHWQQGFLILTFNENDLLSPNIVNIQNGTALINGKMYFGEEDEQINLATYMNGVPPTTSQ